MIIAGDDRWEGLWTYLNLEAVDVVMQDVEGGVWRWWRFSAWGRDKLLSLFDLICVLLEKGRSHYINPEPQTYCCSRVLGVGLLELEAGAWNQKLHSECKYHASWWVDSIVCLFLLGRYEILWVLDDDSRWGEVATGGEWCRMMLGRVVHCWWWWFSCNIHSMKNCFGVAEA